MNLFLSYFSLLDNFISVFCFALRKSYKKKTFKNADSFELKFTKSGKYFNIDKLQFDIYDEMSQLINFDKLDIFLAS